LKSITGLINVLSITKDVFFIGHGSLLESYTASGKIVPDFETLRWRVILYSIFFLHWLVPYFEGERVVDIWW
jgi:hypothetical protein